MGELARPSRAESKSAESGSTESESTESESTESESTESESGIGGSGCSVPPLRVVETAVEERFSTFVAAHRARALRLAWRLTGGDPDAAEDVAQDAFVKAYRNLDQFRGEAKLETWFYRILVRQAANHRRWRAVRDRWSGLFPDDAPDP